MGKGNKKQPKPTDKATKKTRKIQKQRAMHTQQAPEISETECNTLF